MLFTAVDAKHRFAFALILATTCFGQRLFADLVDDVLDPVWEENATVRETVQFLQDTPDSPKTATLTFVPSEIRSVKSAAWSQGSAQRDYRVAKDVSVISGSSILQAASSSPIPAKIRTALHKGGWGFLIDPKNPLDVAKDTGGKLAASENRDQIGQIEVVYRHRGDAWSAWKPTPAWKQLSDTLKKLQRKEPLNILLIGDSISEGLGSSSKSNLNPGQPCYATLFADALKRRYAYPNINVSNQAHAGWCCGDGVNQILLAGDKNVMKPETDLVIVAFGMNDAGNGVNKNGTDWIGIYKTNLSLIIAGLRKINPKVEIILVSPMLGNPEWSHTILPFFTSVRQHPGFSSTQQAIRDLAETQEGVAVADVTAVWVEVLRRKGWQYQDLLDSKPLTGWYDLAANGLNHPNDYGHMIYAQVLAGLLTTPK